MTLRLHCYSCSSAGSDADRKFNERRQRALTRYYLDAGAGGVAGA